MPASKKILVLFCLFLFAGGFDFYRFSKTLERIDIASDFEGRADFIAVLTGGQGRLKEAFSLLKKGASPKLFISGTEGSISLKDLLQANPDWGVGFSSELAAQVILDATSKTTLDNARAISDHCKISGCKSLILVTSSYHLPRAKKLLVTALKKQDLKDVEIISFGVASPNFPVEGFWTTPLAWEIAFTEYLKYRAMP